MTIAKRTEEQQRWIIYDAETGDVHGKLLARKASSALRMARKYFPDVESVQVTKWERAVPRQQVAAQTAPLVTPAKVALLELRVPPPTPPVEDTREVVQQLQQHFERVQPKVMTAGGSR